MTSDIRAIVEAEMILLRLAKGPCRVCTGRLRYVVIWEGVANGDPDPCLSCGWTPVVINVVYADRRTDGLGETLA